MDRKAGRRKNRETGKEDRKASPGKEERKINMV